MSVRRVVILLAFLLWPGLALAQTDALSPSAFSGQLDLRASAADGERSWLDHGFGKTRVGGRGHNLSIGEADIAWRPHFGFAWSAVVEGEIQPDHDRGPRVGEAYLKYKPLLPGGWRATARAGLFYPPISQEHEGAFWTPAETITPSAINSWVGEEIKVVALEAGVSRDFGDQSLGLTLGVFGYNDTAGTLLALRGWSLDDVRTNASGRFDLPPLSSFMNMVQPPMTQPVVNINHRLGGYGRIDWSANARLSLNVFYYDNQVDPTSENGNDLWGWRTQFLNLGARYQVSDQTAVLAQVMTGETKMGFATPHIWVDTGFSAGYLMLTHKTGPDDRDSVTARLDAFSTTNKAVAFFGQTQENGWSLTADYRKRLTANVAGLVELLHVQSSRPSRANLLGEAALQRQTVLQAALRLSF